MNNEDILVPITTGGDRDNYRDNRRGGYGKYHKCESGIIQSPGGCFNKYSDITV